LKILVSNKLSDGGVEILMSVDAEVPKKFFEKSRKVPNALSVQEVFI
jgi:acylphosphatase